MDFPVVEGIRRFGVDGWVFLVLADTNHVSPIRADSILSDFVIARFISLMTLAPSSTVNRV